MKDLNYKDITYSIDSGLKHSGWTTSDLGAADLIAINVLLGMGKRVVLMQNDGYSIDVEVTDGSDQED